MVVVVVMVISFIWGAGTEGGIAGAWSRSVQSTFGVSAEFDGSSKEAPAPHLPGVVKANPELTQDLTEADQRPGADKRVAPVR
jgi:hypothetical protein